MFFRLFCLSALLGVGIYWFSVRLTPEDPIVYQQLMTESVNLRTTRALEVEPACQKRKQVSKTMWLDNETRTFNIESEDSELTIGQKKDKIEAVEILHNICCEIPNELNLTADFGIYTYPLSDTLIYENPKGHILLHDIHFSAKQMIWEKKNDLLYLIDDVKITQEDDLNVIAKRGKIYLNKMQPTNMILEHDVQLLSSHIQGKKSHAMSEKLTYSPQNKTFLFSGAKRVLFWQDGLTLSANEVLIHKDQTVEGHGDVHFTFDLEEQNKIHQFFNKYL